MSKTSKNELLVSWLKDAYSMEKSLLPVLKNHAEDARDHDPQVRRRNLRHLEETKRHAALVEYCLERLGEKPSAVKSAMGSLMGRIHAASFAPFRDELMKNFISDYAAEQFEIAAYRAIIAAARATGEEEIASVCEEILEDEEKMAQWLDERMALTAQQTVVRETAEAGSGP